MEQKTVLTEGRHYEVTAAVADTVLDFFIVRSPFLSDGLQPAVAFSEEHCHASYELVYCKRGSGVQFIRGIGRPYADRSLFLFAPFVKHAHISDETSEELRYSIRFERGETAADNGRTVEALLNILNQNGFYHTTADDTVSRFLDLIAEVILKEQPHAELLLGGLLSVLFSYVFHAMLSENDSASDPVILHADSVHSRKFLIDHFFDHMMDGDARLEDFCRQMHLSPGQMNRVIKEYFGTTFKQKMIDIRLCYAKYFLQYSDLSISDIARRTNFTEDSNFSIFFKQHCHMTPSQYRKLSRSGSLPPAEKKAGPAEN